MLESGLKRAYVHKNKSWHFAGMSQLKFILKKQTFLQKKSKWNNSAYNADSLCIILQRGLAP